MRKCTGNNTQEWGFEAVLEVTCPHCGNSLEFFKDEITRTCPRCHQTVTSPSKDYGCGQWCSAASPHARNLCSKFLRSKHRFIGHYI